MNTKDKRLKLSRPMKKLLLSNLLLLLGIAYRPMLQVCLGAVAVLSIESIFDMDKKVYRD